MADDDMTPEAVEAIRIADKHLVGYPPRRRLALALDIQLAIVRLAGVVAKDAIAEAFQKVRAAETPADLCKNRQPQCRPDGGCLQCAADAGETCRPLNQNQQRGEDR